ncbi:MAG: beta-ketoacyl-[acyl-carrier-protein] synthase family protein [Ekhidna sp.]|nr:beta-ketoacyl-[acyl-carrier-protein] synthase family protein [Ekhidna sp.]
MKNKRIVITGVGVVASNGIGKDAFMQALKQGKSGIKRWDEFEKLNIKCQIGGVPDLDSIELNEYLPRIFADKLTNKGIIYGCLAGLEAWKDAGLKPNREQVDYSSGIIMGAGDLTSDSWLSREFPTYLIDRGESRKLGSRTISECMNSGAVAYLNNLLGLGNRVQANSSACITGSEAVLMGYEYLQTGRVEKMLCGSTEGDGRYIWGGFDAMRVLCNDSNDNPAYGSRPMSSTSSGFVPSGGSGALVLETLESARNRGAKIYAEILGGHTNSGGQRGVGTMTANDPEAVVRCIKSAMESAEIKPEEIDLISGHLTSTKGDPIEVENWVKALEREGDDFPMINAPKSMIGHSIAGAGSIELIACALQIKNNFIHPSLNTDKIHPNISSKIFGGCIPQRCHEQKINTVVKANFGFGDLNCVIVLKKFT